MQFSEYSASSQYHFFISVHNWNQTLGGRSSAKRSDSVLYNLHGAKETQKYVSVWPN